MTQPSAHFSSAPTAAIPSVTYASIREEVEALDLKIGDKLTDGSIYAGISPTTRRHMAVMSEDLEDEKIGESSVTRLIAMNWIEATRLIQSLTAEKSHGHVGSRQTTEAELLAAIRTKQDDGGWRLATKDELNDNLFTIKESIGGFKNRRYWSLSEFTDLFAYTQDFGRNLKSSFFKDYSEACVRCVRSDPVAFYDPLDFERAA